MKAIKTTMMLALLLMCVLGYGQSAGPDQSICQDNSFGYATATMTASGTGTWSGTLPTNPSSTIINNLASPTTYITGFALPGVYGFVWSAPVPDTVYVTVLSSPVRPVLTLLGQCFGSDTLLLTGTYGDSIEWIHGTTNLFTTGRDSVLVPSLPGFYQAFIYSSNGCHSNTSDTVFVTTCIDSAGPNQTICADTATMAAIGTGTWSAFVSNPSTTAITTPSSPTTTITGFTVGGYYGFIWTTSSGVDTIQVNYRATPQTPLLNAWNGTCLGDSFDVGITGDPLYWLFNGSPTSAPPVVGTFPGGIFYQPTQAGAYTAYRLSTCGVQSGISDTLTFVNCGPYNAGPDQTICQDNSFGYATAIMAATGTGIWSATLSTNPSATIISDTTSPTTFITGFTVPGVYGFVWSAPAPDTIYITVLPSPGRPVLNLIGQCLGSDTLKLTGVYGDSIMWVQSTAIFSTGHDSILLPSLPGFYLAFLYGSNGCYSNLSDTVFVNQCQMDTVWPGDADANHLVDNNDLLPIGLAYDSAGPVRAVQGIVWQGVPATLWGQTLPGYSPAVDINNADCNGDGIINADDTLAIFTNFGDVHAKTNTYSGIWRSGIPGIIVKIVPNTVLNGNVLTANISVGDSAIPASNIYGLAFTYNYDALVLDTSTVSFAFIPSWIGSNANSININKNFGTGQVKAAITGIDHIARSGNGQIATFTAVVTTGNINGKDLSYYTNLNYISDITAIDQYGNRIQLNEGIDSNYVAYTPNGINPIAIHNLSIYPNPAATQVRISADANITGITITNLLGETVKTFGAQNKSSEIIDISQLSAGVYIVHASSKAGSANAKLVIRR